MVLFLKFLTSKTGIITIALVLAWGAYNHAVNEGIQNAIDAANHERNIVVQAYDNKAKMANEKQKQEVTAAYEQGQLDMKEKLNAIPKKITKVADSKCTITTGFVQFYADAFKLPSIPFPTGGSVDSPSGISLSSIARADAINATVAFDYKREALAWREWFKRNKAEYDAYCAKSKSCAAAPANSK